MKCGVCGKEEYKVRGLLGDHTFTVPIVKEIDLEKHIALAHPHSIMGVRAIENRERREAWETVDSLIKRLQDLRRDAYRSSWREIEEIAIKIQALAHALQQERAGGIDDQYNTRDGEVR